LVDWARDEQVWGMDDGQSRPFYSIWGFSIWPRTLCFRVLTSSSTRCVHVAKLVVTDRQTDSTDSTFKLFAQC